MVVTFSERCLDDLRRGDVVVGGGERAVVVRVERAGCEGRVWFWRHGPTRWLPLVAEFWTIEGGSDDWDWRPSRD